MAAEQPFIEPKSGIVIHTQHLLKEGRHKIREVPAQQRIGEINEGGSGCPHCDSLQKNFCAQLTKGPGFIFQWYIPLPIRFL